MNMMSLWGADFEPAPEPQKQKKLIEKVSKPKQVKTVTEKVIKSKSSSGYNRQSRYASGIYRSERAEEKMGL